MSAVSQANTTTTTTHAPTHAEPSLPVNQNPNPTPPNIGPPAIHDTAATFCSIPLLTNKEQNSDKKTEEQFFQFPAFCKSIMRPLS